MVLMMVVVLMILVVLMLMVNSSDAHCPGFRLGEAVGIVGEKARIRFSNSFVTISQIFLVFGQSYHFSKTAGFFFTGIEEGVEVTEQVVNFPKPLAFGSQAGTLSTEQG